ncbi:uncharacterized protein PITG_10670 [Phytophthora infestans T30-4]|uniref:Uncharacterized protein n=1 Tax=Phytophthora infestans (strain T30-4) TaxID=403677 RepID=D0NGT8_PHYIT|nr:uncharacterized protein PITG_10670 [Phytophthora infestans T30-4]EEY58577.1 hypothetical protein PITG_10670 [Phytophthora infestans T30-4]|eukprot:XP_002901521.1 hypothetical protein PITG_10670 [Phytophthora infestans T30-4]
MAPSREIVARFSSLSAAKFPRAYAASCFCMSVPERSSVTRGGMAPSLAIATQLSSLLLAIVPNVSADQSFWLAVPCSRRATRGDNTPASRSLSPSPRVAKQEQRIDADWISGWAASRMHPRGASNSDSLILE